MYQPNGLIPGDDQSSLQRPLVDQNFLQNYKAEFEDKKVSWYSKNALLSQIWFAMIAYLLLSYMKFLSSHQSTINSLAKVLRTLFLSHENLWDWLVDPFGEPAPLINDPGQLELI